jgi:hypothetical protein
MKKIIILSLILMGLVYAKKYEIVHVKRGGTLNVRDIPTTKESEVVGRVSSSTTGISVKECTEAKDGSEWCYINAPRGGSHLEGWVKSYYLAPMSKKSKTSRVHIQNFLHNFYMADEENFLDKLQVFYRFPMQKYLRSRNVSHMDLRAKKVHYYKRWPKRNYRLTYLKILKRNKNYIDVQTTVRWKLKGHDDYEAGKDIQKLRLIPVGNTFKVSAMKYLRHTIYPKPKPVIESDAVELKNKEAKKKEELKKAKETLVKNGTKSSDKKEVAAETLVKERGTGEVLSNKNTYYIKSGSFFGDISPTYLASISNNGFPYLIQKIRQGKKVIRRVFIGPFTSSEEAANALDVVRAKINEYAYIQRDIHR